MAPQSNQNLIITILDERLKIKGGAKASGRALFQGAAARDSRVDFYIHTLRIYGVSVPARFMMISREAVCMISWALVRGIYRRAQRDRFIRRW